MSIYDDVLALQQEMEQAKADISAMKPQELAANTDLNSLTEGRYTIPNAAVCGTLLNKPVASNATGYIEVTAGGDSGQKIMRYFPCAADESYYQRAFFSNAWREWQKISLNDSYWIDLPLAANISAYSNGQKPQYRKIGDEVFIRGVYTGTGIAVGTTIATLPANYRPSQRLMRYGVGIGMGLDRLEIETDGTIKIAQTTVSDANISSFHSFGDLSFLTD